MAQARRIIDVVISRREMTTLILRSAAVAAHLHDLRIELADDFDQVFLCRHHLADVLVNARHFVRSSRQYVDTFGFQILANRLEPELVSRRLPRHPPSCSMRS